MTLTKRGGRYHTYAWVRPSSPNTTVTIGLREYRQGKPVPGSNTLGWTVEGPAGASSGRSTWPARAGRGWALEIMARDPPPAATSGVELPKQTRLDALCLLVAGSVLVRMSVDRGRHRPVARQAR